MQRVSAAARVMFGYHAASDKKRRQSPRSTTQSEDKALDVGDRKKIIATARDQRRNFALLGWMIRQHLDFVSRFHFQARTGNDEFDRQLERLVAWRSRAYNTDVAARHSLPRFLRLMEASRTVDGDVGIILLRDGRLQAIEGDRIARPTAGDQGVLDRLKGRTITHGVEVTRDGRARNYLVCKRSVTGYTNQAGGTTMELDRVVAAKNFHLLGYYDRFDQVRGVSPLAGALNSLQDLYEGLEFALIKAKMAAMFGVAIKRNVDFEDQADFVVTDQDDGATPDADTTAYNYELKPGLKLELAPGDDIDTIESRQPSVEFQDYAQVMAAVCMSALDIPYVAWDARRSSYSAQRQHLITYCKSVAIKRLDLLDFLARLTGWDIARWSNTPSADDERRPMLELPGGMLPRDVEYAWVPDGVPWIDPLKEVQADGLAVAYGFKTRDDVCRERYGTTYRDVVERLGAEEAQAVAASATITIGQPGQVSTREEEAGNEANEGQNAD